MDDLFELLSHLLLEIPSQTVLVLSGTPVLGGMAVGVAVVIVLLHRRRRRKQRRRERRNEQ